MLKILWQGLFPVKCLICRREGAWLCPFHHHFPSAPDNKVFYKYLDEIHTVTAYSDPTVSKLITYFKFKGFRVLAPLIAQAITYHIPPDTWHNAFIIPIPLHWQRQLWRGYNQAGLIGKYLEIQNPNLKIQTNSLKRVRKTAQQARLNLNERQQNLTGAFRWQGPIPDKVILLDDVVASGQTLDQAAKVIKRIRPDTIVIGVVFARGGK